MSEVPEALEVADSVEFCPQPYAYAAARLLREQHAEIEQLKAALPYDWNQLEACRESLREHMAEIKRLKAVALQAQNAAIDLTKQPATKPAMPCGYPHCCAGNRCEQMFAGQCSGPRAADLQQVGR